VGIEGGVAEKKGEMEAFAWVVIRSREGLEGKGRTGTFFLPPAVQELVNAGKELGEADDIVFGRENSKQQNGAVGLLTGDVIDRTHYYTEAVVLALIPFKNKRLYFP
jgi:non-canonical (house-cleaning) NTP pyrophosphatase